MKLVKTASERRHGSVIDIDSPDVTPERAQPSAEAPGAEEAEVGDHDAEGFPVEAEPFEEDVFGFGGGLDEP